MGPVIQIVQNMEERFLVYGLEGGGDILLASSHGIVFLAKRAKKFYEIIGEDSTDNWSAALPGHRNSLGVMEKVFQVEPKLAFGFQAHHAPQPIHILRLAIGS